MESAGRELRWRHRHAEPPPATTGARRLVVHRSEGGDPLREGEAHATPDLRIRGVERRQAHGRVEAADGLHQVGARAEDVGPGARGDQLRVRDTRAAQGAQHTRLATHRLVALLPLVERRPAQHVGAPAPIEAEQDVLRAAAPDGALDRTWRQARLVHLGRETLEVDALGVRRSLYGARAHGAGSLPSQPSAARSSRHLPGGFGPTSLLR